MRPDLHAVVGRFNSWRRKYWRTRVLVLLLVYSPFVVLYLCKHSIVETHVRIANDAIIDIGGRAPLVAATADFHRVQETRQLQRLIRQQLDANRDGVLNPSETQVGVAAGLRTEELDELPRDADLDSLLPAAQRLGVAAKSQTTAAIRRHARRAGMAEAELLIAPQKAQADADFVSYYEWPDYSRWGTWQNGMTLFGRILVYVFTLGSPLQMLAMVLAWLSASGLAVRLPRDRRRMAAMLATVAVTAAVIASADFLILPHPYGWVEGRQLLVGHAFLIVGLTCLGMATGALGIRLWSSLPWQWVVPIACCLCLGCAVLGLSMTAPTEYIQFSEIHLGGGLPPLGFSKARHLAMIAYSAGGLLALLCALRPERGHSRCTRPCDLGA